MSRISLRAQFLSVKFLTYISADQSDVSVDMFSSVREKGTREERENAQMQARFIYLRIFRVRMPNPVSGNVRDQIFLYINVASLCYLSFSLSLQCRGLSGVLRASVLPLHRVLTVYTSGVSCPVSRVTANIRPGN